jgi:hypothetical protein
MGVHFIVHRHDAWLKARVAHGRANEHADGRLAPVKTRRLKERRVAFVWTRVAFARIITTTPHWPWVSEHDLKARRSRHLLQDNPTSG